MAAYVDHTLIKEYLDQLAGDSSHDVVLDKIGVRATAMVNEYLLFAFDGYAAGDRVILSWGTAYLMLPSHALSSISRVDWLGNAITGWVEQPDGSLYLPATSYYGAPITPYYGVQPGWAVGWYTVTGNWGYGNPPDDVVEVALEIAINIFRSRDKGMWTEVIGTEGAGGLRFTGGLTKQQRDILELVKAKYIRNIIV